MQPLRGDVEVDAAVAVGDRETGFGSERRLVLHPHLVLARHDHLSACVLVASADLDRAGDVAVRVQARGVGRQRPLRIGERLERLVLDADRMRRSPGVLGMIGRDQRDRLAPVTDHVHCQDRLVGNLETVNLASGHVLVGEHCRHSGHRTSLARIDRNDSRVRVRTAHGRAPQHPVHLEIGRVREVAASLESGVGTPHRLADAAANNLRRRESRLQGHVEAILSAASWTASRIFA